MKQATRGAGAAEAQTPINVIMKIKVNLSMVLCSQKRTDAGGIDNIFNLEGAPPAAPFAGLACRV